MVSFYVLVMFSPTDFYVAQREEFPTKAACEQRASETILTMNMAVLMDSIENKKETKFEFGYVCK